MEYLKMRNPLRNLTGKLVIFSFIFFIISIGSIGLVIHYTLATHLTRHLSADLEQRTIDLKNQLEEKLIEKMRILRTLSENVSIQTAIKQNRFSAVDPLFADWIRDDSFRQFMLIRIDGTVLAPQDTGGRLTTVSREPWFAEAKTDQLSNIRFLSANHDSAAFWMRVPLKVRDESYFLCAQINWRSICDFFDRVRLEGTDQNPDHYIVVFDKEGTLLYAPAFLTEQLGSVSDRSLFTSGRYEAVKTILKRNESGSLIETDAWGNEVFMGYCVAAELPLTIIASESTAEKMSIIQAMRNRSVKISLMMLLIGLLGLSAIIRKIIHPIHQLVDIASGISEGRYPEEKIRLNTDNETMKLVHAFNFMGEEIKNREKKLGALYEAQKVMSLELKNVNENQEKQALELKQKNEKIQQTLKTLKEVQENLLKTERLAAVGETSGQVAHEVLNLVDSMLFRVENDLSQWEDWQQIIDTIGELVEDWKNEYDKGTLITYLKQLDSVGRSYGEEDFTLLENFIEDSNAFTENRKENLEFIFKQMDHIITIINSPRKFVFPRRAVAEIHIVSLAHDVIELFHDSLEKRHITTDVTADENFPVIIADETELKQALSNLIRNSIQSIDRTKRGAGLIEITAAVTEHRLELRVRDNGSGVAKEVERFVFENNFTAGPGAEETGFGLGISRRLIRKHGGDLVLEKNTDGLGATFLISYPLDSIPSIASVSLG